MKNGVFGAKYIHKVCSMDIKSDFYRKWRYLACSMDITLSKYNIVTASSASRYYCSGHFCDQFFTKFNDTECVYDREPERSQVIRTMLYIFDLPIKSGRRDLQQTQQQQQQQQERRKRLRMLDPMP